MAYIVLISLNARNNIKRAGSSPTTDISLGNVSVERYQTYKTAGSDVDFSKKIKSSRVSLAELYFCTFVDLMYSERSCGPGRYPNYQNH